MAARKPVADRASGASVVLASRASMVGRKSRQVSDWLAAGILIAALGVVVWFVVAFFRIVLFWG